MSQNKTIDEILKIYAKYKYVCFVCKEKRANQLGHIIGNTRKNRKKYTSEIIDSPLNVLPVCSLHCNSLVDISNNPIAESEIVDAISYGEKGSREYINGLVRDNIARKRNKR